MPTLIIPSNPGTPPESHGTLQAQNGEIAGFEPRGNATQHLQLASFSEAVQNSSEMRGQGPPGSSFVDPPRNDRPPQLQARRPEEPPGFGVRNAAQNAAFGGQDVALGGQNAAFRGQDAAFGGQDAAFRGQDADFRGQDAAFGAQQPAKPGLAFRDPEHHRWGETQPLAPRIAQQGQPGGRGAGNPAFGIPHGAPGATDHFTGLPQPGGLGRGIIPFGTGGLQLEEGLFGGNPSYGQPAPHSASTAQQGHGGGGGGVGGQKPPSQVPKLEGVLQPYPSFAGGKGPGASGHLGVGNNHQHFRQDPQV